MKKNGFTLMEILLVIVVMAILGTIVMSAATSITRAARNKRATVARSVLQTAFMRYRSEYRDWPDVGGKAESWSSDDVESSNAAGENSGAAHAGDTTVTFSGADNARIFGVLREGSSKNPSKIRFLDESTVFTIENGKVKTLAEASNTGDMPLIYLSANKEIRYFTVRINYEQDKVTVE